MTSETPPKCHLEPINLNDPTQYAELQRQRIICGWDHDPKTIQKWKCQQEASEKSLFWITIPDPDTTKENEPIKAGHISLDTHIDPALTHPSFPNTPTSLTLSLKTFFILPPYRAHKLGRQTMLLIEKTAKTPPHGHPNCTSIVLTALSKRYFYDDGPEWGGVWERIGAPGPVFCVQEWYEKLGYVAWKEEGLYEERLLDGGVVWLVESCMRKVL